MGRSAPPRAGPRAPSWRVGAAVAWACALFSTGALFSAGAGCSSREPFKGAPRSHLSEGEGGSGDDLDLGSDAGPPGADASGLCGNAILPALIDAPNIYFVLDASGSMGAAVGSSTRYKLVRNAAIELVRSLGPLINVGAAVFPEDATDDDSCRAGGEVMPVAPGDAFAGGFEGPTTTAFRAATKAEPFGGTPTAATLEGLRSTLVALPGRTIVLLATDGGPNCNEAAVCSAKECISNIEGAWWCDPSENCCDPSGPGGPTAPLNCIDALKTVSAIADLEAAGVNTYVVGIPGSEVYADALDAMALAGGAAQPSSPRYFRVSDLSELGGVLGSIASVVISCEIGLSEAPPDKALTNVYLDQELLLYDEANGWRWASDTQVELRGEACARLKTGKVKQVQIVSGCPTEAAK